MKRCFIFLFLSYLLFTGCSKDDTLIDDSPYASVSIYAVAQDAPDLNFFLNGNNIAVSVPFGSYTLYNRVSPGTVALRAQSTSRNINIDTSFSLAENRYYSLFLTGTRNMVKPVILHDSFPSPDSGYCGLRFLVFSSGVPAIDIHFLNSDSTLKGTIWANRNYSDNIVTDSINTFKKFPQGTYSFFAINRAKLTDTIARFTSKTFVDSTNYTLMLEGHFAIGDTSLILGTRVH